MGLMTHANVRRKTLVLSNLAQILRSPPNQPDLMAHQPNVSWGQPDCRDT